MEINNDDANTNVEEHWNSEEKFLRESRIWIDALMDRIVYHNVIILYWYFHFSTHRRVIYFACESILKYNN
jgi:hypothetical protein